MTLVQDLDAVRARLKCLRELRMELEAFERKANDYREILLLEPGEGFANFRNRTLEAIFWLNLIILEESNREQRLLTDPSQDVR